MAAPAALLSSKNQRWQTPQWFLDLVRAVGAIYCDPATARDNPTGARVFFTRWDNGLWMPWPQDGLLFCNPPYGRHLSGDVDPSALIVKKDKKTGHVWIEGYGTGWAARMAQHHGEAIYLVPCRVETTWWRTLNDWCDVKLQWSSEEFGRRINFVDAEGAPKKNGSTFASTVFYGGPNAMRFIEVFGPHGTIELGSKHMDRAIYTCIKETAT